MINPTISQYLTPPEQRIVESLNASLKGQLVGLLAIPEGIKTAQKVVKVIQGCDPSSSKLYHLFLGALLQLPPNHLTFCVKKLRAICKIKKIDEFFATTTSNLIEYHPKDKLLLLIEDFHSKNGLTLRRITNQKSSTTLLKELLASSNSGSALYSSAIKYLSSLEDSQRLSLKIYSEIFHKLEADRALPLNSQERAAILKLIVRLTSDPSQKISTSLSLKDLEEILQNFCTIHNLSGEEIVLSLGSSTVIHSHLDAPILKRCLNLVILSSDLEACEEVLEVFFEERFPLAVLYTRLNNLLPNSSDSAVLLEESFDSVRHRFASVNFPMAQEGFAKIERRYEKVQQFCVDWKNLSLNEIVDHSLHLQKEACDKKLSEDQVLQLLALGRLAFKVHSGKFAYNTQILTVLGLLFAHEGENTFAQVKTGEGKSLIITLLAFVQSMQNKGVDIVSSSRPLAKRDCKTAQSFFKPFKILVSSIGVDNPPSSHFKAHILFGTSTDFEFAIMREKLGQNQLFIERTKLANNSKFFKNFQCVIVDEGDNLTLDTQQNEARIAMEAEVVFAWVYKPILDFVKSDGEVNLDIKIQKLRTHLEDFMQGRFKSLTQKIIDEELKVWVKSASQALLFEEGRQYIYDKEKEKITIVDAENTGCLVENSRWGSGLHEFVEAKHNLEVLDESLVSISLSHVNFYTKYETILGLTGTLGSQSEREELFSTYGIHTFDIPPHFSSKRVDLDPILLNTEHEANLLRLDTLMRMHKHGRPSLVLFDSINTSNLFAKFFREKCNINFQVLNGVQEEDEEAIIAKAGLPGQITIATNLASRGTDICLAEAAKQNGGLFVLLSSYSKSQRVEDQGRGRAGRQGQPGSSQFILSRERQGVADFKALVENRNLSDSKLLQLRLNRTKIVRYVSKEFTEPFFSLLQDFKTQLQSESLADKMVDKLFNVNLLGTPKIFVSDVKEALIANELLALFKKAKKSDVDKVKMRELFLQIKDLIEHKILYSWASDFYKPLEAIMKRYKNHPEIVMTKGQILFESKLPLWKGYLDPKQAMALIIREMFNRDLSKALGCPSLTVDPSLRLLSTL